MNGSNNEYHDSFLDGNEAIEKAIHAYYEQQSQDALFNVLGAIHVCMAADRHVIVPVDIYKEDDGSESFELKTLVLEEGKIAAVAFTSQENFEKAPQSGALSHFIDSVFTAVNGNENMAGILLNPWGESFLLTQEFLSMLLKMGSTKLPPIEHQRHPYLDELDAMDMPYVNAHINNISFPTTIEGLEQFVYEHGQYNVEDILTEPDTTWTVPRSAKIGDIVLFFHAKTAISRITALITEVKALPDGSGHDKQLLLDWLERARSLYKQFGGKVFAVGRVTGSPEYWADDEDSDKYHWHGRIYADVGDIVVLDNPIDISEFNSFIKVSRQSAITPLPAKEFDELREIIAVKNEIVPEYFLKCEIGNFDLAHINGENFLAVTQEYRRRFLLEIDFRSYYVDHLLKGLVKRKFWQECICHTEGKPNYFVDNVFSLGGKYYLLEVKLNVHLEKDLHGQLKQYVNADYLYLDKEATEKIDDFERRFMYVIDTEALYCYDTLADTLTELVKLDDVTCIDDVATLLQKNITNTTTKGVQ